MSLIRSTQYPGRWNVPDSNSPQGSGKNRTSPSSNDGSYFDQVWFDDMDSLHQALFIASGITPNGTQDVGTASQIFDALLNNRWSAIGNYSVGTIITASDGKKYYCNQPSGRDTTPVDPVSDSLDNWREYPYEKVVNANGTAFKRYNGDLEMFGSGNAYSDSSPISYITLPVPLFSGFDISTDYASAIHVGTDAQNTNIIIDSASFGETTKIAFKTEFSISILVSWSVKGRWA